MYTSGCLFVGKHFCLRMHVRLNLVLQDVHLLLQAHRLRREERSDDQVIKQIELKMVIFRDRLCGPVRHRSGCFGVDVQY